MDTIGEFEEPETFEDLVWKLYEGFPNGMLKDEVVEDIIVTQHEREELVENGYLTRELHQDEEGEKFHYYNLGPRGLDLISSWETEELTKKMATLTLLILILTATNVVLTAVTIFVALF